MRTFPIPLFALLLLLAGCWGEAKDKSSRDAAFEEVLGFGVPPDVTEVKSSWYFMKDTHVRWLCFSCSDATISKIKNLRATKLTKFSYADEAPGKSERNPNAPSWWTGAVVPATFEEIEVDRSNRSESIESDIVHIWIDSRSRKVYAARHRWH